MTGPTRRKVVLAGIASLASNHLASQQRLAQPSALAAEPEGWEDLLPPPSLEGWVRVPIPPTDGIRAPLQWQVEGTELICTGQGQHEWLRWDQLLGDFILHVEWQVPASLGSGRYNGGIGVRLSRYGEIWHQAQTTPSGGFLFGDTFQNGRIERVNLRQQMSSNRVLPAGNWNVYEIRCQGSQIDLWVNGEVVSRWGNCQVRQGYIGLEAEGSPMRFRNLKLKRLSGA